MEEFMRKGIMELVYRCCLIILIGSLTSCMLVGCSAPTVFFKKEGNTLSISTEPGKLLGFIPYGGSLPAGAYSLEIGGDKASMDTKVDLKILEMNLSKISEQ